MTLRAGQTIVVRDGVSAFGKTDPTAVLAFKLEKPPACGDAKESSSGIVLAGKAECVGQKLEFAYAVTLKDGKGARAHEVEVAALVERGIESCGLADAPFRFLSVPGGVYSLANLPARLSDVAGLAAKSEVSVKPFCITEEAIPADELAAYLATTNAAEAQKLFPEALAEAAPMQTSVEMSGAMPPATSVSYRMAQGYASKASAVMKRSFSLPTLDHYIAATLFLERNKPTLQDSQMFAVSMRGGLLEWTKTPCEKAPDTFITLGTDQIRGRLTTFCYAPARRASRMAFRLIMESVND